MMMNFVSEFAPRDTFASQEVNDWMKQMLVELRRKTDGDAPLSEAEARWFDDYVAFLVDHQTECPVESKKRQWAWVTTTWEGRIPGDAFYDFVKVPTVIAFTTLVLYAQRFPEKMKENPSWMTALRRGGDFLSVVGIMGHGFDNLTGSLENLRVFAIGNVYHFQNKNPELCPEHTHLLNEAVQDMERGKESSFVSENGWSKIEANEVKEVLDQLKKGL